MIFRLISIFIGRFLPGFNDPLRLERWYLCSIRYIDEYLFYDAFSANICAEMFEKIPLHDRRPVASLVKFMPTSLAKPFDIEQVVVVGSDIIDVNMLLVREAAGLIESFWPKAALVLLKHPRDNISKLGEYAGVTSITESAPASGLGSRKVALVAGLSSLLVVPPNQRSLIFVVEEAVVADFGMSPSRVILNIIKNETAWQIIEMK